MKKQIGKKTKAVTETAEEKISRRIPLASELLGQKSHEEIINLVEKLGIRGALLEAIIRKSKDEKYDIKFINKLRRASNGKGVERIKEERKALSKKVMERGELTHKERIELTGILKNVSKTLSTEEKEEIKKLWKSIEEVKKTKNVTSKS